MFFTGVFFFIGGAHLYHTCTKKTDVTWRNNERKGGGKSTNSPRAAGRCYVLRFRPLKPLAGDILTYCTSMVQHRPLLVGEMVACASISREENKTQLFLLGIVYFVPAGTRAAERARVSRLR